MNSILRENKYESPRCINIFFYPSLPIAGSNEQIEDDEDEYGWE